ncbi:MAG: peptidoglycan bridge formation glycyltransferase FemA/FemB family protein, partial [Patescibacteria group bacterium]
MSTPAAEVVTPTVWNERIRHRGGSFLQSWEWGAFQEWLGRRTFRITGSGVRALVLRYDLPLGFSYLYLPRGPVSARLTPDALAALLAEVKRVISGTPLFVRMEPVGDIPADRIAETMRQSGFVRAPDAQPSLIRVIDLSKSEEALLAGMEHDTRYAIRSAGRRGVTVRVVAEADARRAAFPIFWELFQDTARRHQLTNYSERYYHELFSMEGECAPLLLLAECENRCIAAALSVLFGSEAVYLYAASRSGYGKWNAPSLVLWELIRAAKARGSMTLDLGGISDTKPAWRGLTAFKRSFGGNDVEFAGTWDLPLRRPWYVFYRIA